MRRSVHAAMALVLVLCGGCLEMVDFTPACQQTMCDGKCIDVSSDWHNCGACGHYCAGDQSCVNGACTCAGATTTACSYGCADLMNDTDNCGACGTSCGAGTCQQGKCSCPGMMCSGQCVDLSADVHNCGKCGNACGTDYACSSGSCETCTGSATPCEQRTQAACNQDQGCKWTTACYGGATTCSQFNYDCALCNSVAGCSCGTNDVCNGTTSCSKIGPTQCNSYYGCSFGDVCHGTPPPCSGLSQAECEATPGCRISAP